MTDHVANARNILNETSGKLENLQNLSALDESDALFGIMNYTRAVAETLLSVAETLRETRNPQPVGACPSKGHHPMGTDIVIQSDCVYDHGHTGAHRDAHGRTWQDQPATKPTMRCTEAGPAGAQCNRTRGHTGAHAGGRAQRWTDNTDTDRCHSVGDTTYPDAPRCVRPDGHTGLHGDAINRTW